MLCVVALIGKAQNTHGKGTVTSLEKLPENQSCSRTLAMFFWKLLKRQASEPGFRDWVPKFGNCKTFGHTFFQGRTQYIEIITIHLYSLSEIRH